MRKGKITMHQGLFYQLYKKWQENPDEYTPIWKLIGEVYIPELNNWAYVSYEVAARMSELWKGNPNLLERQYTVGKSGSKYYEYRIRKGVSPQDIKDESIIMFHRLIRSKQVLGRGVDNSLDRKPEQSKLPV